MTIHEFGEKENPVIMLLPGTMCYWEGNFGHVIEALAKNFYIRCISNMGGGYHDGIDHKGKIPFKKIHKIS